MKAIIFSLAIVLAFMTLPASAQSIGKSNETNYGTLYPEHGFSTIIPYKSEVVGSRGAIIGIEPICRGCVLQFIKYRYTSPLNSRMSSAKVIVKNNNTITSEQIRLQALNWR